MLYPDPWSLGIILFFTAVVLVYVLKLRNPRLTTVTIGPLFLYIVAGVIGIGQLYIMGTVVLSICVWCCLFALHSLRGLRVSRTATTPVERGDVVELRLDVENRHWAPKLFLRVRCPLPQWLRADSETRVISGLWPGHRTMLRLQARAVKRGHYVLPPVELVGSDPLGVFQLTGRVQVPNEVTVYPTVDEAPALDLLGDDLFGALPARRVVRPSVGLDFHSLREYQPGDDVRTVDWKATARLAKLIVVQHEPPQVGDLVVLLDNRAEVQAGEGEETTLERGISVAAGAIVSVLEARGNVRLRYLVSRGAGDLEGRGAEEATRFLDALARVEPQSGDLASLAPDDVQARAVLIVTPDGGPEAADLVRAVAGAGGRPSVLLVDARSFAPDGELKHRGPRSGEEAADALREAGARVMVVGRGGVVQEGAPPALASTGQRRR